MNDKTDVSYIDEGEINEPIGKSEQLPIAWVYPEFMKNIKDAKCWTAYATYHEERPIPLYTRPPVNELSDEEIEEVVRLHSWIDIYPKEYINDFARAIIKTSRGKE